MLCFGAAHVLLIGFVVLPYGRQRVKAIAVKMWLSGDGGITAIDGVLHEFSPPLAYSPGGS